MVLHRADTEPETSGNVFVALVARKQTDPGFSTGQDGLCPIRLERHELVTSAELDSERRSSSPAKETP